MPVGWNRHSPQTRKPLSCGQGSFWQYSDKGRLEGYEGEEEYIDLNVFGGGEEAFARWLEQA